ncbi:protein LEO1 homolog isoform X1 [Primulina eburnea]|uniref:protein LEO1 homolog isoform X1 n=1 Tax=Primulina eburnea TaxID=1245227 RepID=UPI003C6C7D5A
MVGEMEKRQILKNLFGDLSEDEDFETNHELNHQADSVFSICIQNDDNGTPKPEKEVKTISKGDIKLDNEARSSRLIGSEKDEDPDLHLAAVIHDVFGDSEDDEQAEYGVQNQINQGICSEKELRSGIVVTDGEAPQEAAEEHDETKLKGKEAGNQQLVFEIPMHPSLGHPNQMATVNFSNLIAIDPIPFDPATYVEQEFYAEDASGFKRPVPLPNIIRWREVKNPDGTTSVESNARFVTWSDGSLQLLIGNKAFDVSEHNVQEIQSHLFLEHWKETYQAQGRIPRKMKVMPSTSSSSSHCFLPDHVDSWDKNSGPENLMEQTEMAEKKTAKANKRHNQKKKRKNRKSTAKDISKFELSSPMDNIREQNSQETKFDLVSSSDTSAEGPFRFSASEKAEAKHGHKGHEDQDAPSGGKPDSIFEQVEEKRNETEAEVSDNFTK